MKFDFDNVHKDHRCYAPSTGDCYFGVPHKHLHHRRVLLEIPRQSSGFHFYLGSQQSDLFRSFCNSELPTRTTSLHIGNTSFHLGDGVDYRQLTTLLLTRDWPKLEELNLGVWQLFCNSQTMYGEIGAIDGLAARVPELRLLELCGRFEMTSPQNFSNLASLSLETPDTCRGADETQIDKDTLLALLSSSMPRLSVLYVNVDPDDEDGPIFELPHQMLTRGYLITAR